MQSLKRSQVLNLAGKKYKIVATLGEGTYGVVYKAVGESNQTVAIKMTKTQKEVMGYNAPDEATPSTVLREVSVLKNIDH